MTWTRGRPPSWGPASTRRRLQKSWTATERSVAWAQLRLCGVLAVKGLVKLQTVATFLRNSFDADWAIWNVFVSGLQKSHNPRSALLRRYPSLAGKRDLFRKPKDTRQIFKSKQNLSKFGFCRCKDQFKLKLSGTLTHWAEQQKQQQIFWKVGFQKEKSKRSCSFKVFFYFSAKKMMDRRFFCFFLPFLVPISFFLSLLSFLFSILLISDFVWSKDMVSRR